MQPMRSCTMEWNLDLPFFDLVGMTYYFEEEEGKKKRGFGAGENWRLHVCELWLDHTKLARCVKGPLTLNIYLTYTRTTLKMTRMNLSSFYSRSISLQIMPRFQLSSTKSSFFELYTHTYTHLYKKI
jgi:hypothetical protein